MPNAHIRDIAKAGVITDPDPYDLPINAWSKGFNVRFKDNKITRSPVVRDVETPLSNTQPRFLARTIPSSGLDTLYIAYKNGRVYSYDSGTETNESIVGYVDADSENVFTSCTTNDVFYINRADRVPWYYNTAGGRFAALTNWTSTHRAGLLRAFAGALVAFNITKSGTNYPTMVRTSEFTTAGAVPADWDETDPTSNATENILAEMAGPIVDAQALRDIMIIYGRDEAWTMQLDPGSESVYAYRKLFDGAGALSANCSVEVNGRHYVFGTNDIWQHDGTTKQSLCDARVRNFVFQNIDISQASRCFVHHNKTRKEVYFCYVGGDGMVAFDSGNATGCNRAAVYDYANDTWSFDDLPFATYIVEANLDQSIVYSTATSTYNTIGGTYLDQDDTLKTTSAMVGNSSTPNGLTTSLYAYDPQGPGSNVAYSVNVAATSDPYLERSGIDLDEIAADLPGYKMLSSLYPQGRFEPGAGALEFSVGACDYANQSINWSNYQTYNGEELYKLDYNVAGRYLAIRIRHNDYRWFSLTGFDADVAIISDE
jgi:hypothetical protein